MGTSRQDPLATVGADDDPRKAHTRISTHRLNCTGKCGRSSTGSEGENRPIFPRSAGEGSVDTASFALPVLRETAFGQGEKDWILSRTSAGLPAPRGGDNCTVSLRWAYLSCVSWLDNTSIAPPSLSVTLPLPCLSSWGAGITATLRP